MSGNDLWTTDAFAARLGDYMAQRTTPWPDEEAMREAVRDTVRLIFTEARDETWRVLEATSPPVEDYCDGGGMFRRSDHPGRGQSDA